MIVEMILFMLLFSASAYFCALTFERSKIIAKQDEQIKDLQAQLLKWQNKFLPSPLGFETRERVATPRDDNKRSIVPVIPTRAQLEARRENDRQTEIKRIAEEFPAPKYLSTVQKVQELIEENKKIDIPQEQ